MSLRALPSLWSRPSAVARVLGLRVISTSDGSRSSPLSAEKTQELREWAEAFERRELGKDLVGCEVRYDRAGGPGGQVSSPTDRLERRIADADRPFALPTPVDLSERQQGQSSCSRELAPSKSVLAHSVSVFYPQVNTKATLRVSLAQASPNWISPSLISSLTSSSVRP